MNKLVHLKKLRQNDCSILTNNAILPLFVDFGYFFDISGNALLENRRKECTGLFGGLLDDFEFNVNTWLNSQC